MLAIRSIDGTDVGTLAFERIVQLLRAAAAPPVLAPPTARFAVRVGVGKARLMVTRANAAPPAAPSAASGAGT